VPVEEAVDYVLQACVGIAEAHRVGVVHRDLKPENLFLTRRRDGAAIVKVVDFGISKLAPSGARRELAITTGQLLGTPFYMSPEQLRGDATVDERSDVWALGVILFELVTADAPFHGDTLPQLCTHIMHDPAKRLSEVRPDLSFPPGLEDVVDRCLAKDAASRYASAGELAAALAPFAPSPVEATLTPMRAWAPSGPEVVVTSRTAPVPLVRRRRSSRPVAVLAVGAAIVVVAGVGVVKMTSGPPVAAAPSASTAVAVLSAPPSVREAPSAPPLGSSTSPSASAPRPRSPLSATKPAPTSKPPSTSRPPADDFGGRL
jgi:serine/threonine-protein kinase